MHQPNPLTDVIMVGSRATVTSEDNLKLLTAHCIFNGDQDKVAEYMGITKNAV